METKQWTFEELLGLRPPVPQNAMQAEVFRSMAQDIVNTRFFYNTGKNFSSQLDNSYRRAWLSGTAQDVEYADKCTQFLCAVRSLQKERFLNLYEYTHLFFSVNLEGKQE